jgi:hypothetical protein
MHCITDATPTFSGLDPTDRSSAKDSWYLNAMARQYKLILAPALSTMPSVRSYKYRTPIPSFVNPPSQTFFSYNHLRHAMASECFAANKILVLQAGQSVEAGCQEKNDCCCNQAAGVSGGQTEPLHH